MQYVDDGARIITTAREDTFGDGSQTGVASD
jgi:hypothetical protein